MPFDQQVPSHFLSTRQYMYKTQHAKKDEKSSVKHPTPEHSKDFLPAKQTLFPTHILFTVRIRILFGGVREKDDAFRFSSSNLEVHLDKKKGGK
jgi:hypothetical protein